jgi:hypothetical protein
MMIMHNDHPVRTIPALSGAVAAIDGATPINGLLIDPATANRIALDAAYQAYRQGKHDAITELITTDRAAEMIGISQSRIAHLARAHDIGWQIGPRARVFRPEDVEAMRQISTGRVGRPKRS